MSAAIFDSVRSVLSDTVEEASVSHGTLVLAVAPGEILPTAMRLKGDFGFDLFLDVTAVDWPAREPRFDVVWHFYSTKHHVRVRKDVVIDMFCYRRFGHNEGDAPTMTQPIMYRRVKDQPTTVSLYSGRLIREGVVTQEEVDAWTNDFNAFLDSEFDAGKNYRANKADWLDGEWSGFSLPVDDDRRGKTEAR